MPEPRPRQSPMRRVGVIGGMGPEATLLLVQRVIDATAAEGDADHVPMLIDMNPQVPSRIAALLEGSGESPGPVIAEMARRLEAGGAEALVMPCNTAHHYVSHIREASALPFLSMLEQSAQAVARLVSAGSEVGILASPATQKVGLFEAALAAHDLRAVFPKDVDASLAAIRCIKFGGADAQSRRVLESQAQELAERGVGAMLVGCSEFSLIADAAKTRGPLVDTLDVLAQAVITFSGARLKPTDTPW